MTREEELQQLVQRLATALVAHDESDTLKARVARLETAVLELAAQIRKLCDSRRNEPPPTDAVSRTRL